MDDACGVDRLQGLGDAGEEQQDGPLGQRPVPLDDLLEGGAGYEGGGEPGHGGVGARVDHLGGVEAVDAAGTGDLLGEAVPEVGVLGEFGPDHLERDRAPAGV